MENCKNLGELLSYFSESMYPIDWIKRDMGCSQTHELMALMLEQLGQQYLPCPIREDGEILREGDEIEGGKVYSFMVYDDGHWYALDEDGNPIQDGLEGEPVRLLPKDAEGKPTNVGDTIWDISDGREADRVRGFAPNGRIYLEGVRELDFDPAMFIHHEPETLDELVFDYKTYKSDNVVEPSDVERFVERFRWAIERARC